MAKQPDWRLAHQTMLRQEVADLRRSRAEGQQRRVYLCGMQRTRRVCDLTDSEIYEIAKANAIRDSERAINQHNAAEMRRRSRKGDAA